ncbi:MAG: heavy metal-associated domain-containing protein [Longimicrobiales bacterium]|nr:heavy metal-associated domain-containing protein [Longimicrobiales bacterium]
MKTLKLNVEGMHCEGCVSRVKSALGEVSGVDDVAVFLDRNEARVEADESASVETLVRAVEEAGYSASPQTE